MTVTNEMLYTEVKQQRSELRQLKRFLSELLSPKTVDNSLWVRAGKFMKSADMSREQLRWYRASHKGNVTLIKEQKTGHFLYNVTAFKDNKHIR